MKASAQRAVMAEINITPLTDVVLVLLLIFMISTPMIIQSGIKVQLPQAVSSDPEQNKTMTVTILENGQVFFEEQMLNLEQFKTKFKARVGDQKDVVVIVNGDSRTKYDNVVRVLDIAKQAGATKFSLGTERTKSRPLSGS